MNALESRRTDWLHDDPSPYLRSTLASTSLHRLKRAQMRQSEQDADTLLLERIAERSMPGCSSLTPALEEFAMIGGEAQDADGNIIPREGDSLSPRMAAVRDSPMFRAFQNYLVRQGQIESETV